jgi:hypothetical protein
MTPRTKLSFRLNGDVWPTLERWAGVTGYRLTTSNGSERTYQKGHGLMVAPMMLSIRQTDGEVAVEAWVRINQFMRVCSLFMLPPEMGIESGGFRAIAPRSIARNDVNGLLNLLGQPPIQ